MTTAVCKNLFFPRFLLSSRPVHSIPFLLSFPPLFPVLVLRSPLFPLLRLPLFLFSFTLLFLFCPSSFPYPILPPILIPFFPTLFLFLSFVSPFISTSNTLLPLPLFPFSLALHFCISHSLYIHVLSTILFTGSGHWEELKYWSLRIGCYATDGRTKPFKKNILHSALKISPTGFSFL